MAGVCLHDQPDFASGRELQGIARGQREVHFHLDAYVDASGNDHVVTYD